MTKEEKLAHLHGRLTRYELTGTNGTRTILICYSVRRGRHTLLEALRQHGAIVLALVGRDANFAWERPASRGARLGEWTFRFSGRTQREAIIEGEHPFVGALTKEAA